jgi:hypothetical protein
MTSSDLKAAAGGQEVEPLLSVEKKLIGFSLGLGIVLLVVLVTLNHLFPVKV